jgi:hypothetical protein
MSSSSSTIDKIVECRFVGVSYTRLNNKLST